MTVLANDVSVSQSVCLSVYESLECKQTARR